MSQDRMPPSPEDFEKALARDAAAFEQLYRANAGAAGYVFYDWNPVTNETRWSEDVEGVLGYTAEELTQGGPDLWNELAQSDLGNGRYPDLVLGPLIQDTVKAMFPDFASREKGWKGTRNRSYRVRHKNGSSRWMSDYAQYAFDESGKFVRLVGIMRALPIVAPVYRD